MDTAPATAQRSARILIIDDDPSGLAPASHALERRGYVVERARGEREAQAIVGRSIPSLILLDLALAGAERLARCLRTDRRLEHVPIVALARSAARGSDGAHEAGCDGCIIGPVDGRMLPLQVAAFLVRGAGRLSATDAA
jgi:CheY-like chemotaxis protein